MSLSESLLQGLQDLQFEEPTKIQSEAIPPVLEGKDLIGIAQTGTGKTGAFIIPAMEKILKGKRDGIKALILSPTRELATQIDEQIFAIGYHAGITSATVIGGSNFSEQARALKAGVDIIVATPGRLMDQNNVVNIDFSKLEFLILDEADRMLDMGFLPDMKTIISWLPKKRQTLLFSATMPKEIQKLAESIMEKPARVEIERSKASASVEQRAYKCLSPQKITLVKKIFSSLDWDSCIIFTSTKRGTDELQRLLKREGIKAVSIHGDRTQDERNEALQAFKNKQIPVIVATDVLARGIDIKGVSIILNYDVPNSTDDYIHRIGRTGRYDKTGIAITLVTRRDARSFAPIENLKENPLKVIQVPESFDESSAFSWDDETMKGGESKPGSDVKNKGRGKLAEGGKHSGGEKRSEEGDRMDEGKGNEKGKHLDETSRSTDRSSNNRQGRTKNQKKKQKDQKGEPRGGRSSEIKAGPETATPSKPAKKTPEQRTEPKNHTPTKEEKVVIPPVLEVASKHNKRFKKPAKGFWGILKSYFQK